MPNSFGRVERPSAPGRANRHGLNRLLVALLLLAVLAPFVIIAGYIITAGLVEIATAGSQLIASFVKHTQPGHWRAPTVIRTPERTLIMRLMPVTIDLLAAALIIVLWGMSSAKTSNLLARTGAHPVLPEGLGWEAVETLSVLSREAGIAPPKLYTIQCGFPTVFSQAAQTRHAAIAITTGAFELLNDREIEALLAHEISHIANRDGRLEAILTALSTITEYPFRTFQRILNDPYAKSGLTRNLAFLEILLSPLGLYIFLVSPILNALISIVVLRRCEFSADAQAATLTGDPESLAYALAKIGGVVTVLGKTTVSSLPAHTFLSPRLQRLMELHGECPFSGLEQAIAKGKQFASDRPGLGDDQLGSQGSLANLNHGVVCQFVSGNSVPLFDQADTRSLVRTRVEPGALLVLFDTPGKMRQVNTAEGFFGYISPRIKLRAIEGVLPQEVYDPVSRAAVRELLEREERMSERKAPALSRQQVWMALGFGAAVFAGTTVLLFVFAGH